MYLEASCFDTYWACSLFTIISFVLAIVLDIE